MKKYIYNSIKRTLYNNRYLLIFEFLIFCYLSGAQISLFEQAGQSLFEYILSMASDHYLLFYLVFPVLFIVIVRLIRDRGLSELVRMKNKRQYLLAQTVILSVSIGLVFLIHFLALFLIGLFFLPIEFGFSSFTMDTGIDGIDVLKTFDGTGLPILALIFLVSAWLLAGLTWLHLLMQKIHEIRGFTSTIAAAIAVYALTILGFKVPTEGALSIFSLNHYLVFHHNLDSHPVIMIWMILIEGLTFLCIFRPIPNRGKKRKLETKPRFKSFIHAISFQRNDLWYAIMVPAVLIILEMLLLSEPTFVPVTDVALRLMQGTSKDAPSITSWLKVICLTLTPVYFLGKSGVERNNYHNMPYFLRYPSKIAVQRKIVISNLFFWSKYMAVLLGLLLTMSLLNQKGAYFQEFSSFMEWNVQMIDFVIFSLLFAVHALFAAVLFRALSLRLNAVISFIALIVMDYILSFPLARYSFSLTIGFMQYGNQTRFLSKESIALLMMMAVFIGGYLMIETKPWRKRNESY